MKFISNPQQVQPPEPKPDPQMIAAQASMISAQGDAKHKEALSQKTMMDAGLEPQKFEWQKKIDAVEAGLEAEQQRPVGLQKGK